VGRGKKIIDTSIVIDAAIGLIEEQGFAEFSTRRLASVLHISAMTLYNYYENRDAILREAVLRGFEIVWESMPGKIAEVFRSRANPLEVYGVLAEHLLQRALARPRLYRFLFETDLSSLQRDVRITARYHEAFAEVSRRIADPSKIEVIYRDIYLYLTLVNALVMNVLSGRAGTTVERFRELVARAYDLFLSPHESSMIC
jgi:AcrR family transcriptional regulator